MRVGADPVDEAVELAVAVSSEAVPEVMLDVSPSTDAAVVVAWSGASVVDEAGESSDCQHHTWNDGNQTDRPVVDSRRFESQWCAKVTPPKPPRCICAPS